MFSYKFFLFLLSLFTCVSFVRSFGFFRLCCCQCCCCLLFVYTFASIFSTSLLYFVFIIFQYVSFSSCSSCIHRHPHTKINGLKAYFLFRLLYHSFSLNLSRLTRCVSGSFTLWMLLCIPNSIWYDGPHTVHTYKHWTQSRDG